MNTKTRLIVSAILLALLAGCSGGSANDVAKNFWKALNDRDLEKAKSYATKESAGSLTMDNSAGGGDVDVEFGASTVKDGRTVIETHMVAKMGDITQNIEMKTVLVQEDGKWKVDVMRTMLSMFGDAGEEMMAGMAEAMGQAMEGMGEAMMGAMKEGFSQFGEFGDSKPYTKAAPEVLSSDRKYKIKFGYMKKRQDGSHYVSKQTKKIPMRTRGFKWGYTIESKGDPFTTYTVEYSPDGPMLGYGSPQMNSEGEQGWETNTTTVTNGKFSRAYNNDPGDTKGPRKIEVYVNEKLAETIEFEIR